MNRLTVNDLSKTCYDPWELCGMDSYCTKDCHEEGGCTKGCEILKMYKKLAEYENLEEQGLLLKIPRKVGDTLYLPIDITNEIVVGTCSGFTEDRYEGRGMLVEITYEKYKKCWEAFSDFGKTVFLTQAEAEEALKKIKSEE